MAFRRTIKRVAKKVARAVKRRYFKGKGYSRPKIGQMAKDVSMLKRLVNTEKRRIEISNPLGTPLSVGQVNVNNNGAQILDITPTISSGTGLAQRSGNSVKIVSWFHRYQVIQQGANTKSGTLIFEYYKVVGNVVPASQTTLEQMFLGTPFMDNAGVVYTDTNSSRNPDYYPDYKCIARKVVRMKSDSTSADIVNVNFSMGKRINHHLRYEPGTNNLISGQILLVIRASTGNRGNTVYSGTGLTVEPAVNSGFNVQYNQLYYYVDN